MNDRVPRFTPRELLFGPKGRLIEALQSSQEYWTIPEQDMDQLNQAMQPWLYNYAGYPPLSQFVGIEAKPAE